jgi:hypothetical protein
VNPSVEALAQAVVNEKNYVAAPDLSLPPDIVIPEFEFLGCRQYVGSVVSLALVDGSRVATAEVGQLLSNFYSFTSILTRFAGRLIVGLGAIKLGSFGVLAFVFPESPSPQMLHAVRAEKRGSAWRKDYAVAWSLDVEAGLVHTHRGFPLTIFPGRRYLQHVLARVAA